MNIDKEIIVVYIGGFLVPRGRIPVEECPRGVKLIIVYPSGVSSLHDRVMQVP